MTIGVYVSIYMYLVLHIGWINKVLLNNTGNDIQYPIINHNGFHIKQSYHCLIEEVPKKRALN